MSTQVLTHNARAASATTEMAQLAAVDIWNLPAFTPASGTFQPDWNSIAQHYRTPEWFREAKFGIWQHWDSQSVPEYGDWYAQGMYQQGSSQMFQGAAPLMEVWSSNGHPTVEPINNGRSFQPPDLSLSSATASCFGCRGPVGGA